MMAISGVTSAVATVLPTAIKPVLQGSASANVGLQYGGSAAPALNAPSDVQSPNAPVDSAQLLNEQIAKAQEANTQLIAALFNPAPAPNLNGDSAAHNSDQLDIFA